MVPMPCRLRCVSQSSRWILLLAAILLTSACGAFGWRAPVWVDLYAGEPAAYSDLIDDLASVQVAYLGEIHTLERHARGQLVILRDLAAKGRPIALALEQMEAANQRELDRYAAGEIDFEQLAQATHWGERWSNYRHYRPLLEAARTAKAPIVALNARNEVIREVGRKGLAGLTPPMRAELPREIQLDDPYEKLLNLKLMVHAAVEPPRLHRVAEAQVARDEQMAEALAGFLQSERGRGRLAIVICGGGHVAYGMGMPARVRRRMPGVTDRIVYFSESGELKLSGSERAMARPVRNTHQDLRFIDRPIADYVQLAR